MTRSPKVKVEVVARSLKVNARSALVRRYYTATSLSVDELSDLRQFQLEQDDDQPLDLSTAFELSGCHVPTTDVKPFHEVPGPRGLPVIGNMLSYSKLGKSVLSDFALSQIAAASMLASVHNHSVCTIEKMSTPIVAMICGRHPRSCRLGSRLVLRFFGSYAYVVIFLRFGRSRSYLEL